MCSKAVIVIGLDSVPPELLFGELLGYLPNFKSVISKGVYGVLESCDPPITVPAWMVMMTSKNPGRLGIYGFRHRKGFSYDEITIANSSWVREKTVWDIVSENGGRVCVIGVPPTYPPRQVNGCMVSCFLTPSAERQYTYPPELKDEIEKIVGKYVFDVVFRTEDRDAVLSELYEMTEKRVKIVKNLLRKERWNFFMYMEIGFDRLHHAFWKYHDKTHFKYTPGNRYENVVRDYYKFFDEKLGEILSEIGNACIFIVSDHGTKGMKGAFCVNEWLIKEGYLKLRRYPDKVVDLEKADVDWANTIAWGWGGYYARIFLNVKGREKMGIVSPEEYEDTRDELARKLREIRDPTGRIMETKVYRPEELYPVCNGDKPDLMVYFDNLNWRSAGTIGHNTLYLSENDKGPDDSVHSKEGIFIFYDPQEDLGGRNIGKISIYDIAPTLLRKMNLSIPGDMEGRVIPHVL